MKNLRRRIATAALCVSTITGAGSAHAETSPADRALAEALFRDARQLADAAKWTPACAKFGESQRLDPKLGTLLFLATCHEKEGKLATAWIEFNEARSLASRVGQSEREKIAKERSLALEPRLAHLVVTADEPASGMQVLLDGKALQSAALGSRLPLDPGDHVIVANAPERDSYEQKFTAAKEGETLSVAIPRLKEKVVAPAPIATPALVKPVDVDEPSDNGGSQRTIGFVVAGIGVVALAGGTYFGVRALGTKSDADRQCDANAFCTQKGLDQHDDAQMQAHFSTAGLALGVIGVGVGTYLVLSAKASASRPVPSAAWQLAPSLTPRGAGLAAVGSF